MPKKEHLSHTKEAHVERSAEDIRQDIAKEKENISQSVEQLGERIKAELDWREYVKDSPGLALGAAVGLGYLASRVFQARTTPMERIMESIAKEVHDSIGGLHAGCVGPSLIKATLLGMATQVAANWIKSATSTTVANDGSDTPLRTEV